MDRINDPETQSPRNAQVQRRRPHYIAGSFWALITLGAIFYTFSSAPGHLNGIWIGLITLTYTIYLYRGGRWVIFFF